MCFAKTPTPKEPPPPPTEREGAMEGVRERQRAAANAGGFSSTIATSPLGASQSGDNVSKPKLGS